MIHFLTSLLAAFVHMSWSTRLGATALLIWVILIIFYTLYLAAVNVWDNRDDVQKWVVVLCAPVLGLMVVCDVIMNWSLFTIFMLDLPREAFVTTRMKRYRAQAVPDWRTRFATMLCTKLLNPFDPTKHHC